MQTICLEKRRHEPAEHTRSVGPPRGVLHSAEAREEGFFHQRLAPPSELASYIQHFWYVQWDRRNVAPGRAETLPHPSCYLVFEHDLEQARDVSRAIRRPEISGVHRGKFSRAMTGCGRVFGLKFRPGGLYPFLQRSVSTLTDQVVPAEEIFGPEIVTLGKDLGTLDSAEAMAEAASAFFATRRPVDSAHEVAAELVDRVFRDPDILSVKVLSERSGMSVRALQRCFKMYVGVSPKWVIRRFRLHEVLERLNSGETFDGAQLALVLGYSDQSHLINDFSRLVGVPPAEYQSRVLPVARELASR